MLPETALRAGPDTPMPPTCHLPTPMGSRGVCGLKGLGEVPGSGIPSQRGHCPRPSLHDLLTPPGGHVRLFPVALGPAGTSRGWLGQGGAPSRHTPQKGQRPWHLPPHAGIQMAPAPCVPRTQKTGRPKGCEQSGQRGPHPPCVHTCQVTDRLPCSALHQVTPRQGRREDSHMAQNMAPQGPRLQSWVGGLTEVRGRHTIGRAPSGTSRPPGSLVP